MPHETIRVMCPNLACQRILAVPSHARGKLVRCRACGMTIRIPPAKPTEVQGAAAEATTDETPTA